MCGRFAAGDMTQAQMLEIMRGFLDAPFLADDAAPHVTGYNVKPTNQIQMAAMIHDEPVLTTARWWFVPHWHKKPVPEWKATTFNAKIETAPEKPTFRTAWKSGRCAIPALGYYEWTGTKGNKQPWYITVKTNQPCFFFAGLHSYMGDGLRTCTILTRDALPQIKDLHARTPVILTSDQVEPWIKGEIGTTEAQNALGAGWDGQFKFHPVRKFGMKDNGPEMIEEFHE
ncbi:SOS response-associated peptidase [Ruegeria sp. EL01]|jgi:putative SOS response-associated peptidase YedK|uniref:SOS response-associated peptidase n=1 Tax=Ruegeria sp. EL01 TaxID=2107578 RepID=UPI000EA7F640|nr:SOS response-associated peptidase [Ruegeria sp. EL01]